MTAKIKKTKIYQLIWISLQLSWFVFLSIYVHENWNGVKLDSSWFIVIGWLAVIQLLIELLLSAKKINKFTDFRVWLVLFLYVFMLGKQILSGVFRIEELNDDPIFRRGYDVLLMTRASFFILLSIHALFFGLFFKSNPTNSQVLLPSKKNYTMYNIGVILSSVCFLSELFVSINNVIVVQSTGNAANASAMTGLFDDFALLFVPSLLYVIASGVLRKKKALFLVMFFSIYYVLIMILTGDRRYPSISIMILFFTYFYMYDKKIKLKHFIYVIGALVLLNLFSILRNIRHGNILSLSAFISTFIFDLFSFKNTLFESFNEFGISFYTVCLSMKYFPSVLPYKNGLTFVIPILNILPLGFLFGGSWYASGRVSDTVNELFGTTVGGSLLGDLFGNFGFISIPILFVLGIIISSVNNLLKSNKRINVALYFSIFFSLISLCRATIYEIMRPFVWSILIPIMFYSFMHKKRNISHVQVSGFINSDDCITMTLDGE